MSAMPASESLACQNRCEECPSRPRVAAQRMACAEARLYRARIDHAGSALGFRRRVEQFVSDRSTAMRRVLIVEDDPAQAQSMADAVSALGVAVTVALTAAEADAAASAGEYGAVVVDVKLSDATVMETIQRQRCALALVVIVAGFASDARDAGRLCGAAATHGRADGPEALAATVGRLLGR